MSFDEFAMATLPGFLRYATAMTCDPHLAEDIVQEVMLRAQRKWQRISATDVPEAYVRRMITNEYLSLRRRRSFRDVPLSTEVLDGVAPALADPTSRVAERDAMLRRIRALPRKQRAALALRYYCGLDDAAIAHTLGCREGTVRSHISRAISALRVDEFAGTSTTIREAK